MPKYRFEKAQDAYDAARGDEKEINDYLVRGLRAEIYLRSGGGGDPLSPLDKSTLNSVYAYLTGEFLVKPGYLYDDDQPTLPEIRYEVLGAVHEDLVEETEPEDLESGLNKQQLRHTLAAMKARGDQRGWMESMKP